MDELKTISDSVAGKLAGFVSAVIGIAVFLPKLVNGWKGDKNGGNVLDRLSALEIKAAAQDAKIHRQAVRITKLVVLVIELKGLIDRTGVPIPSDLKAKIQELTKDEELGV